MSFVHSSKLNFQRIAIKFVNSMSRIIFYYAFLQLYLAVKEKKGVRSSDGMSEGETIWI